MHEQSASSQLHTPPWVPKRKAILRLLIVGPGDASGLEQALREEQHTS